MVTRHGAPVIAFGVADEERARRGAILRGTAQAHSARGSFPRPPRRPLANRSMIRITNDFPPESSARGETGTGANQELRCRNAGAPLLANVNALLGA
jgi:hypothetical protein